MIGIDSFPQCGFGNRIIYYYNLRNESIKRGCKYFCVPWEGHDLFEGHLLGEYPIVEDTYDKYPFCLGERFFEFSCISTREVFKLKSEPDVPPNTCAVHFRGTDFHSWNPDSILDSKYYLDSIEYVASEVDNFILFTDDISLASYKETVDYLKRNQMNFILGQNSSVRRHYVNDFTVMSRCDSIISSPSSYNVCAGFIGKRKKIIHSSQWVLDRVNKGDRFWVDLYNGGNDDYCLWKLI